ncbi:hypothetical protein [Niabella ginsenosidivorans]|uniref:hypothetical protein n=1 Tax=Niabella ginsenosidivorans TaxID=1176587 RepID=UPI0012ECF387|nr:hypothetical protein [Niabella ginsenosidivorans]
MKLPVNDGDDAPGGYRVSDMPDRQAGRDAGYYSAAGTIWPNKYTAALFLN